MSIIQKIRDKYARIAVIAIALALLGFILMDALVSRNRGLLGSGNSNVVGRVNGKKIDLTDFNKKVEQQEAYQKQQGYSQGGEADRQQAIESVWNQEVSRLLMSDELDKLGMQIGKKELGDILYGPNAPDDLKKQFTDQVTGQYNPAQAKQQIDQMLKRGTADQKAQFNNYLNQLEYIRQVDKYNALFSTSINFPRWFLEKQNADNSQMGKISMVREVYSSIPDSSVKISDQEITDYISKHKDDYPQKESRSIAYVTFNASASAADSGDAKKKAAAMIAAFDSTKDIQQFLGSEGAGSYYDGYISGKTIKIAAKDSIFKTPVGHVYGPYLDGGSYVLAKVLGVKQMPDTVKVRHILVATAQQDQQTGQMVAVKDSTIAKKLIDSIQTAIRNGSNFDSVCAKLSDDGTKSTGGVYDNVTTGKMVAPFNDFIFENPVGFKGIVKTIFGYHYIEILSQKGSSPAYKIAYFPEQIVASPETDNNASNLANQFAADSRDQKSFDVNYEKTLKPKGVNKGIATDIKPEGYQIQGLGMSRQFVRNIYLAKKGDVLQPERIGDDYVVAVVTGIYEEGTQSPAIARLSVEPLLRNKKKAELIKLKIGKVTTLEAAATALGKSIEMIDSLRMTGKSTSTTLGFEPKVNGATFNPGNKGKLVPEALAGVSGVYVVRVDSITATAIANANVAEQRKTMYQQSKQTAMYNPPVNALRLSATIKDKRADRF
jgi:peptidyl-prolyl cis-trans isomerase D